MKCFSLLAGFLAAILFSTGAMAEESNVDLGPAKFKVESSITEVSAKVTGIDHEKRIITLEGPDGNTMTTKVDDDVMNFKKIKKGNMVDIEMMQSTALVLKKNEKRQDVIKEKKMTTYNAVTKKKKPVKVETEQVRQIADITGVNKEKGTVMLVGIAGQPTEVKVQDPKSLEDVKKGDQVEIIYTESVAFEVTKK
jgi:hypothetical protein